MSDADPVKGSGWTDRERLAYLFALIEHSKVTLDYKNAPRPAGRTQGACQIMVHRLKGTLKHDLEALKAGRAGSEGVQGNGVGAALKRKRKGEGEGADGQGSPLVKRGRKKKADVQREGRGEEEEEGPKIKVKAEPTEEELEREK